MSIFSNILQKMRQNGVCRGIGISHGVVVICQLYLLDLLDILDLNVLQSLWEITARRRDAVATPLNGGDAVVTFGGTPPPHRPTARRRRYHGLAFTVRGFMRRF